SAGYAVGDRVAVLAHDGTHEFTVAGITGFGENDSLAGATLVGFDLTTAQQVMGKVGGVDQILVLAEPQVDAADLLTEIGDVVPDGVEALSGKTVAEEGSATMQSGLAVFTQVLLVFAAVS